MTTVRVATANDLPAVGRLGAELVAQHHAFDPARFIAPMAGAAEGYARFIGTQLSEPAAVVLVAERDGAVVGYAYATLEPMDWMSLRGPAGVLHDIIVSEAARGGGAGRALLDAVLAELARRGAPRTVLSTAARNAAAQRFFARHGFRPTMVELTREAAGDPGAGAAGHAGSAGMDGRTG